MGMPATITQNQTGTSAIWFPDWMQSPFAVSIQAIATGAPGYNVEFTLDNIDVGYNGGAQGSSVGIGLGTTASNATWFQTAITGQTISTTATLNAPVRAMRVNVITSSATAVVTVTFVQANYPGS
jgi:hypothetical protein